MEENSNVDSQSCDDDSATRVFSNSSDSEPAERRVASSQNPFKYTGMAGDPTEVISESTETFLDSSRVFLSEREMTLIDAVLCVFFPVDFEILLDEFKILLVDGPFCSTAGTRRQFKPSFWPVTPIKHANR